MDKFFTTVGFIFVSLWSGGCTNSSELGSKNNPVKIYFTPSVDADSIASNSKDFIKFSGKRDGAVL